MKLFIRDKIYFTDPTTGEFFEDTISHVDDHTVIGKNHGNLTNIYQNGILNVYRLECYSCGCTIPQPLSHFQVEGLKGNQSLLPSRCRVCIEEGRYPEDNPEEGITLWI